MKEHPLIDDMRPGLTWRHSRKVAKDDLKASVDFAWDYGGYHVDERYAASGFSGLITSGCPHVALIAGLAGHINLLGRELTVRLADPVYEGDELEVLAEVPEVHPTRGGSPWISVLPTRTAPMWDRRD